MNCRYCGKISEGEYCSLACRLGAYNKHNDGTCWYCGKDGGREGRRYVCDLCKKLKRIGFTDGQMMGIGKAVRLYVGDTKVKQLKYTTDGVVSVISLDKV
ncbi:MAG: hypothetical protein WC479_05805 [Candidatus Izemoplasmatales bacterium]